MKESEKELEFEIRFYEGVLKEIPHFIDALIPLAEAYTKKGLYEKGLIVDRTLSKLRPKDPVVLYNLACSLALLGKNDESIAALKKAVQFGYEDFEHMEKDADLKSIAADPQFQALLKKGLEG